jgi:hypothetical protein
MLNRAELRDLLHLHYLAVGEMWERGGMVFEVAADERGRLEMRETR